MRQVYDNQTIANTSTEDNTTRSAHQHMGCITVWFTTNPGWTHGLISSLDKPLPHPFYRQNKKGYNTPGKTTWNGLHRRQTSQADTTLVHTATHHQVDPSFVGGLQYTSRTTSLLKPIGRQQTQSLSINFSNWIKTDPWEKFSGNPYLTHTRDRDRGVRSLIIKQQTTNSVSHWLNRD